MGFLSILVLWALFVWLAWRGFRRALIARFDYTEMFSHSSDALKSITTIRMQVALVALLLLQLPLTVTVWRGAAEYSQAFSRGAAIGTMSQTAQPSDARKKGTRVRFKPDADIFKEKREFDPNVILSRMKELAFLNSTATFKFRYCAASAKKARSARPLLPRTRSSPTRAGKGGAKRAVAKSARTDTACISRTVAVRRRAREGVPRRRRGGVRATARHHPSKGAHSKTERVWRAVT